MRGFLAARARGRGRRLSRGGAGRDCGRRASTSPTADVLAARLDRAGLDGAALLAQRAGACGQGGARRGHRARGRARRLRPADASSSATRCSSARSGLGRSRKSSTEPVTGLTVASLRSRRLGGAGDAGRHGACARRRQSGVPRAGDGAGRGAAPRRGAPRRPRRRAGAAAGAARRCWRGWSASTSPLFSLFGHGFSLRDLVLLAGGFFLLVQGDAGDPRARRGPPRRRGARRGGRSASARRSRRSSRSISCSPSTASSPRSA